jgi:CHAT domain-containing protein
LHDEQIAERELLAGVSLSPAKSEAYVDIAFKRWLPFFQPSDSHVIQILRNLAMALQTNHGDYWLTDFLKVNVSGNANKLLAESHKDNIEGKYTQAIEESLKAQNFYRRSSNTAGIARTLVELIYAYRRQQNPEQCIATIKELKQKIRGRRYAELEIQAEYESANCLAVKSSFDKSWHFSDAAIHQADIARYPSLQLRTLSLLSSLYSGTGRLEQAWQVDLQGLSLFWQGAYSPERGFQFYSDLALTAEQTDWWCSAASMEHEALSLLDLTARADFKVLAHLNLATDLRRCGELDSARSELDQTTTLLGNLKEKRIPAMLVAIALADIDTQEGHLDSAASRLQEIDPEIGEADNFEVKLLFYKTSVQLQRRLGHPGDEEKFLLKEAEIAWEGFSHLHSEHDRWAWYSEVDDAYHRLTEIRLQVDNDKRVALAKWEEYRAALVEGPPPAGHFRDDRSKALEWLDSRLDRFRSSTLLSFVIFSDRVDVWIADSRHVEHVVLQVDPKVLQQETTALLTLCSDKNSPEEKAKSTGARLYDRLLGPIERLLSPDRLLVIEADGFLNQVPWAALVTKTGTYVGELYMLASTPGLLHQNSRTRFAGKVDRALIAYPGAVEFEGSLYPPLPHAEEEAEYVHKLYPGSRYLKRKDTHTNDLLRLLSQASLFHFAGHAASRSQHGELLVQGANGAEIISADTLRRLRLSQTDLVVLSACSSAIADRETARNPNGLVEALLAAGAKQVIATRWELDSGGSFGLMRTFYRVLRETSNAALAIRESRREAIAHSNTARPYYWAAFELFASAN